LEAIQDGAWWILQPVLIRGSNGTIQMFHVEQIVLPKGEKGDFIIARLNFGPFELDCPLKQPRRRSGLEPTEV
jgi:hypothetical protein